MNSVSRNYKVKDVEMLITASTIIENAIANKAVLQAKRRHGQTLFLKISKTTFKPQPKLI